MTEAVVHHKRSAPVSQPEAGIEPRTHCALSMTGPPKNWKKCDTIALKSHSEFYFQSLL